MAVSVQAPRPPETQAEPARDHGLPVAWRLRAGVAIAVLVLTALAVLLLVVFRSVEPATPAAAPAPAVDQPVDALTPGQLTTALQRSAIAPNNVNLQLTYAPPIFFQVTGKEAPKDASLVFYLQEDTHIDALDAMPPRFAVTIDGGQEYVPTSGTILSDSGHHRLSSFVFTQPELATAQHDITATFHFSGGQTATSQWLLPLQLTPVAVQDEAASSARLVSLNATLRRVLPNLAYGGITSGEVTVTYATPEYFKAALSPESARRFAPDQYAVFLVSETSHTADLPSGGVPLSLEYQGNEYAPDLVEPTVASSHHRVTLVRFPFDPNQSKFLGRMDLHAADQTLSWGLPVIYTRSTEGSSFGGLNFASLLSLVGGMLAAMWPCLFQLTVFFIPALAGVSMEEARSNATGVRHRFRVLKAALFFILGFTLVYTAAGGLVGFVVQQFGNAPNFEAWQRYFGIAAGLAIIVLALRTAAKVRAPIVCKMPVLSRMAHGRKASSPLELMVAGLAFATGCMTCFGAALIIAMVVYVGMAGSAWVGALTLFMFSIGMGVPLVIAACAMGKVLPMLTRLERVTPWLGLASSVIMIGFAIMLMTGNYMAFTNWLMERL